jgi:hypothetical protein
MAKSVDEQIRATWLRRFIGQTTESYKSVMLEL